MNIRNKIFLLIFVPITIVAVGALYYRIFVKKDFLIIDTSSADDISTEELAE